MLIPAKALNYGGARSRIQVQLPNGKILSALAATPINSPKVAIGFDQNGQAWVWGETSKIDLQATSIRKTRPFPNQEPAYPFKVVAQWETPYIAQAGDRPSKQVIAQSILAFGNRGKKKNDFILLAQTETDQYRLTTKEQKRNLNFSSSEFLNSFKNGRFYGDDYYGLTLISQEDFNPSDVVTTGSGNTIIQSTPDGGFYRIKTSTSSGSSAWNPPLPSLYSPPIPTDIAGNVSDAVRGYQLVTLDLIPLPPDPLIISGVTGDYTASSSDRANWNAEISACVAGASNNQLPPPAITAGGTSNQTSDSLETDNIQRRQKLLSGSLDSISKTTAIKTQAKENDVNSSGQTTVTPEVTLVQGSVSGGLCASTINNVQFNGAYYEYRRPYFTVNDQTSQNTLKTEDAFNAESYSNSISIRINNSNLINYAVNLTSNSNYTFSKSETQGITQTFSTYTQTTETTDTRETTEIISNAVTALYKGSNELCLYSKIDNATNNYLASRLTLRKEGFNDFTNTTTTINGESNYSMDLIDADTTNNFYLANGENTLSLEKDYFYIRIINIKNIINLSQLLTTLSPATFNFNIGIFDIQQTIGRLQLYFDYPVSFSVQSVVKNILSNPPQNITSKSATPITFYNDNYYLNPNTNYPIELIVFEGDTIYKLLGTASINYQNTARTFSASNFFFPDNYGQLSYSEVSLATVSVTLENYQLIKYHALKEIDADSFGHLYSAGNCLGLFQKLLGQNFSLQSGIRRTTLYKRKNGQVIMAFSDNANLTKKDERYADLYRLEGNKFIREGEKKGAYYPVKNPNTSNNPSTSFIGYYD